MTIYILFGIYILALLFLFAFIVIFTMHIRDYLQYSRYIRGVLRIYLVSMIVIAIFGGYKIITGSAPSLSSGSDGGGNTNQGVRMSF